MNIVKGVADLIRRSSSGHSSDSGSTSSSERFAAPAPRIRFSEDGDEGILNTFWERYINVDDKFQGERKKLRHIFLKQFIIAYKNWVPIDLAQSPESSSSTVPALDYRCVDVIGCSAGHPAEVILMLIEELTQITTLITELASVKSMGVISTEDQLGTSTGLAITSEALAALEALTVIVRSMHNCRVFGHYGGIQKLAALMKAAVVQLKTITSALSVDETLSNSTIEKIGILQKILVLVVSVTCSYIRLNSNIYENVQSFSHSLELYLPSVGGANLIESSSSSIDSPISEERLRWHQKAVVSVMEAGGLNWLVELLRVMRRLSLKEQRTDISLQYLTLCTLQSALADNPRGQNHFRSIGGLEVLLDGLGFPSINYFKSQSCLSSEDGRGEHPLLGVLQLHVLSLEVLREAVFGNLNNLQFLFENGRVQKFANSFCSPAFMLQEFNQQSSDLPAHGDLKILLSEDSKKYSKYWRGYTVKLSRALSSFLLSSVDLKFHNVQTSTAKCAISVSSVYGELSIKWIMRVLLTVFPCIKACSNQNELPCHLRVLVNTLQHYVLFIFQKVLVLSPSLLDVFRVEGVWDFIFSENFFYFGPTSADFCENWKYHEVPPWNYEPDSGIKACGGQINNNEAECLQIEVISFVKYAATLDGSSHNLPECSVLLDALEQSAFNPEISALLAENLLHILQLSSEKTISSFKALDAISRVLKVACILAQESERLSTTYVDSSMEFAPTCDSPNSPNAAEGWLKSMETLMELFAVYISATEDAKKMVLQSSTCIDSLFDLFWEESLRNRVLSYILDLMKIPYAEVDRKAKLYLCSKYLETFPHVKERERNFAELSVDLLVGMRDMLLTDEEYYQALFRDGECFLHVVSLLNGNLDEVNGEKLVLNVLQTLTCLLARNDGSKAAFRALVGKGYQTLQSLLLDFCHWRPCEGILGSLLDMLVDGKFDLTVNPVVKNEDVILLYLSVLQKSSGSLRHHGLNLFLQLLRDSICNRASCVRAGMLNFLLDWFAQEVDDSVVLKIAQLIQVIGGHSISGKEIRKIFALLRSEKVGMRQQYCSLLLTSILSMLNENGPTAFFDLNGDDSGIIVKTPVQWPMNKGFSFSCWLRIENFPKSGEMGLFCFLTEIGRGCLAVLAKEKLIFETINQKKQSVSLPVNLVRKKWHFLCLTHSIGRAFSGGSLVRCYVDGVLVSSEKCSYAKVAESLTNCTIAAKIDFLSNEDDLSSRSMKGSSPFFGQIGPVYMFSDALTSEQVRGIFSLGPSYMYSFLDSGIVVHSDNPLPGGILDPKDGLASKIIFGLNAQASNGRTLFNVSPLVDHSHDKRSFGATVKAGTQLCSRRLLKQIIYCVGGVSVFFPLFTQYNLYENEESEHTLLTPITKERVTAEIIELIASVLDDNLANQQQMLLLSGFSILGFLLQSVPPQQLNMETLSALKHMFNVVASCGLSDQLVKNAICHIFLNPFVWVFTVYKVQRELYMFLIQQFDNDPGLLKSLCRLPRVLDIIRQFYWDNAKCRSVIGSKPQLHPLTDQIIGERPSKDEVRKIRLLLLSLGEMSLRQAIAVSDIKALVAFFELSQDMACIEDVLHIIIRAVSQKPLLASFLEQVNLSGGCHIFVNLLQRDCEPIRLLSLQLLGRLLVGLPSEKKGSRFFDLSVGKPKLLTEGNTRINLRMQAIFSVISDRLFRFPLTDNLCATLFDVLLGGASPKQVLQKNIQLDCQKSTGSNSLFFLPQVLVLIIRFLSDCECATARMKIINDLLDLLDSHPSNIEAFMENGWNAWLAASTKLDVLRKYKEESIEDELNEYNCVRKLFCVVLCHYIHSFRGGWQHLEETVNFLLMQRKQGGISYQYLLRDIYEDLVQRLIELSPEDNIFISQPCRDNTLYLLKLIDELLISEIDNKLPFPASTDFSPDFLDLESHKEIASALYEALHGEPEENVSRNPRAHEYRVTNELDTLPDRWWSIYDKLWIIISQMNGKGSSTRLSKTSPVGPSFGQRARGLVESLNIPAAEMAAVVVSGGITNALAGRPNYKMVDKAMLLRGEKCPRIVFRLLILYLCKASLGRASKCAQQVIPLLPNLLTADDEHSKNRLQLFIWSLLSVRSHYGSLDDGARFHVIAHLIRETVNCGKSMLVTSLVGREDSPDSSSSQKETGAIQHIIQKDRVLAAAADEVKYIKTWEADQTKQLQELSTRIEENSLVDDNQKKDFEDEIKSSLAEIIASDDNRRICFQLAHDEEQQTVAEQWIHTLRSLIDERGPWSANPFPNTTVTHWKLDKTEDAWRRRQKLRRNYHFDAKLCLPPSTSSNSEAVATPVSETKAGLGVHIPEQMKRFLLKGIRRITDEGSSEPAETDSESCGSKGSVTEDLSDRITDVVKDSSDQKDTVQERKDSSSMSTEEASEVLVSVPCVLVTPNRKVAGQLAVMKKYLHFFGEFIVEGSGGSSVFKNFNTSGNIDSSKPHQMVGSTKHKFQKWPIDLELDSGKESSMDSTNAGHSTLLQKQPKNIKRYRRWNICKINGVHWTRYLLRYTAIEIFFNNSVPPVFLNFSTQKVAKDVGTLIVSTRNDSMFPKGYKDKSAILSFVDRRVALEMAETARESWRRRDITNFEYLMILNTLAGRSYNDLTQYPVFPWILADYTSATLDFNKSSTFRDLSKPVGALDPKRFEVFEDRYHNFCDPDIPSFYYGSHYSSMGIVLYYLLRLEPFTALHRTLQGGKFDHADRLFQSIDSTFQNCLSNTSDVKELVPEFFYMPEFLVNSNTYHLGIKQDGEPLSDVCLPPWAKGSPEEFISKNREALESEYVSSNLHQWIDLVFGYKQRGKPAVEAANIFYYLTYEGAVDLDTMDDELQRSAIEDQIANFGQTPIQVFRKKHPRRGPPIPIAHPLRFAPASICLTSIVASTSSSSAILYIRTYDSHIVLVNEGLTMSVKMWLTTQLHSGGNFTFSSSQEPFFGIGSDILSPRKIGSPSAENIEIGAQCFASLKTPSENFLISCGNWENSFQVISQNDGRVLQSIRQHKDVVSCVAVTSDGSILATGSYDTTVMVWDILRTKTPDKRVRSTPSEMPRKDCIISETPFHILCGHDDVITCLYVSVQLDIVISGSKDGTCVFHTLREGRYVRSLSHPSGSALSKLVASHHGRILFYADDDLSLHLYSINGKHLATSESNGRLNCIELSNCGEFLVCAGDQGQIVVRSMNSLEIVRKYSGVGKVITSLTVTQEECFLAGTKEGSLLVYSIENPQLRKSGVLKNQKPKMSAS